MSDDIVRIRDKPADALTAFAWPRSVRHRATAMPWRRSHRTIGGTRGVVIPMLLLTASLATTGCAPKVAPQCFDAAPAQVLNALEEIVLADAKARTLDECREPTRQCSYWLKREPGGEFFVSVTYATVFDDGTCGFGTGDHEMHLYDRSGKHTGEMPGM